MQIPPPKPPGRFQQRWKMFWLRRSGTDTFGRIAAWLACWNTLPHHRRSHLAGLVEEGFVAPSARIAHPDFHVGRHVFVGDDSFITGMDDSGTIELGDQVQLYGGLFMSTGRGGSIHIGERTHVQPGCHIHAYHSDIHIGNGVEIAAACAFYSYDHGMAPGLPIMSQPLSSKGPILIGDDVWLGHGVTILQNVTIGRGAVVAAGAVVVHDIPANAIAAGIPAKVIKFRDGSRPGPDAAAKPADSAPMRFQKFLTPTL